MKKLKINAGYLDVTELTPEKLAAYDSIKINGGVLILNPTARELLAEKGASLNMGIYFDVPDKAHVMSSNGRTDITAETVVPENCVLLCNGALHLHPGSAGAVAAYAGLLVNGRVILPESMRGALSRITLNGDTLVYPDDARFVSGDITVDRRFARQVDSGAYLFTGDDAFLTDPAVDAAALLDKNVVVHAQKAYVSQEIADGDMLFDMQTEVVPIPAGYAFVRAESQLRMDAAVVARYGKKLFVLGDVRAEADDKDSLDALESLIVYGNAQIAQPLLPVWNARCQRVDSLSFIDNSRLISKLPEAIISRELLEACEHGLSLEECELVTVLGDMEPALLAEKVKRLTGCAACVCTEAQQSVLQLVAADTNFIRQRPEADAPDQPEISDCIQINAGFYKL